ncbi:MAG: DUF5683 domain-containing protein [Gemmatimonadaceae bacterium]
MTRLSRAGWVRFPHSPASAAIFALLLATVFASPSAAQRPDTLRSPRPIRIDILRPDSGTQVAAPAGPRISPGGAFLQSLLIPGRGQITLGKRNASRFYIAVEALGIGMTIKSLKDLREAKRGAGDSTAIEFKVDPVTGDSTPTKFEPSRFTPELINARRTHVEDWVALIIFNHLLSAADAYVAANLWDFPASVSLKARPAPVYSTPNAGGSAVSSLNLEARIRGSIAW